MLNTRAWLEMERVVDVSLSWQKQQRPEPVLAEAAAT